MILICLFVCEVKNKTKKSHKMYTQSMLFGGDIIQTSEEFENDDKTFISYNLSRRLLLI
jgi:hypothetical protein